MNARQLHEEIRDTNICLLQLTQKMIRTDKAGALADLGVSDEMADLVAGLSPAQLMKMSATNMMMCTFHFDEKLLFDMVTGYSKDKMLPQTAAARKTSRIGEAVAA